MIPILIVDDSREDSSLLERIFRQCKILNPITHVDSGEACLSLLRMNGTTHRGDRLLVIVDLMMAPLSGVSLLRSLKNENLIGRSVFVMLSGITDLKAINEGYQLGAQTFLVKPVKKDDIIDLLDGLGRKISMEE